MPATQQKLSSETGLAASLSCGRESVRQRRDVAPSLAPGSVTPATFLFAKLPTFP